MPKRQKGTQKIQKGNNKKPKEKGAPPPPPLEANCQNRQAGWRKVEKKGTAVGKKKSRWLGGGTRGTSGSARSRGVGTVLFSALSLALIGAIHKVRDF